MDPIDPVWLFGAIALVAGVLLGMLIVRLLNPVAGDLDRLKTELEQERAEMERYKASVNSHFDKTSELVSELTQDYVKVYRHLAEGAQTLSDTREFKQVLEQSQGRVLITVEKDAGAPLADSADPLADEIPVQAASADVEDVPLADAPANDADSAAADVAADDAAAPELDEAVQTVAENGEAGVEDVPPKSPDSKRRAAQEDDQTESSSKA